MGNCRTNLYPPKRFPFNEIHKTASAALPPWRKVRAKLVAPEFLRERVGRETFSVLCIGEVPLSVTGFARATSPPTLLGGEER